MLSVDFSLCVDDGRGEKLCCLVPEAVASTPFCHWVIMLITVPALVCRHRDGGGGDRMRGVCRIEARQRTTKLPSVGRYTEGTNCQCGKTEMGNKCVENA